MNKLILTTIALALTFGILPQTYGSQRLPVSCQDDLCEEGKEESGCSEEGSESKETEDEKEQQS